MAIEQRPRRRAPCRRRLGPLRLPSISTSTPGPGSPLPLGRSATGPRSLLRHWHLPRSGLGVGTSAARPSAPARRRAGHARWTMLSVRRQLDSRQRTILPQAGSARGRGQCAYRCCHHATQPMQQTPCTMQHKPIMQHTPLACTMQHTPGNMQQTPCNMQHTPGNTHHASRNRHPASCNAHHSTTHTMKHATHTMNHATDILHHATHIIRQRIP